MNLLEVKIRDKDSVDSFNEDSRNLFGEVWNSVAFKIGIRKSLVDGELKIIFEFMSQHFKLTTLGDVRDAFSLYSAQRLDYTNSHYQSLDNPFIGNVLKSHQRFKAKENMKPKIVKVSHQIEEVKEDPKVTQEKAFDFIDSEFEKNGKCENGGNWNDAFLHMQREGLIVLSNDEKQMFKDNVIEDIKHEIKQNKILGKMINSLDMALIDDGVLKYQCRKRMIINYYKNK